MVNFLLIFLKKNFEYKINQNSKNMNRKIDFSFVSAHCASSIKMGPYLRRGGICISLVGKYPKTLRDDIK